MCSNPPLLCPQAKSSLELLSSPVARGKFDGPLSVIEPLLAEFQSQWAQTKKETGHALMLSQQLQERVQGLAEGAGTVVVDYSETERGIERRENELRARQEGVWRVCEKRELRWNRAILLNQFEPDVEKVKLICRWYTVGRGVELRSRKFAK